MHSGRLFYEDEFDAISTIVGESGKGFKACAMHLWPDMKPESAYAKLKACTDPNGAERLKFSQVVLLMKFCQRYDPLLYICDETLHARPDRKTVEDESVKLTEAIDAAAQTMTRAMVQLERLRGFKS